MGCFDLVSSERSSDGGKEREGRGRERDATCADDSRKFGDTCSNKTCDGKIQEVIEK